MRREETSKVLSVIKATYPRFFTKMTKQEGENFLDVWTDMFEHDNIMDVMIALKAVIRSTPSDFPPNIGQIVEMMNKLSTPLTMDADMAWSLVYKALGNSIYNAKSEFDKLPIEVQTGVGSHEQLRTWAKMNVDELNTVVASLFKRGYRGRIEEKKEFDMLPLQAKELIGSVTDHFRITSSDSEEK